MTDERVERVRRIVECDTADVRAAVLAASPDERQDAQVLLALAIELSEDAQMITRMKMAELAGLWPELDLEDDEEA